MKGVADRTLELMNEFHKEQYIKSYRSFQHFLVVKIEELEDENKVFCLRDGICEWQYDEHNDVWETTCSNAWQFMNDGPKENACHYCMYCGGVIDVLSQKEQSNVR